MERNDAMVEEVDDKKEERLDEVPSAMDTLEGARGTNAMDIALRAYPTPESDSDGGVGGSTPSKRKLATTPRTDAKKTKPGDAVPSNRIRETDSLLAQLRLESPSTSAEATRIVSYLLRCQRV
jgi:hypothetical protein